MMLTERARQPAAAGETRTGNLSLKGSERFFVNSTHPLHAHMIGGDATLSQQCVHVSVGQPITQLPPNRDHDHIRGKPNPQSWASMLPLDESSDASPKPA